MKRRKSKLSALAKLRDICKWTQSDLARLCGVSLPMIKKVESQSRAPSARRKLPAALAFKIALMTGVSPSALVNGRLQMMDRTEVTEDSVRAWWRKWSAAQWAAQSLQVPAFQRKIDVLIEAATLKESQPHAKNSGPEPISQREPVPLLRLFSIFDRAFQEAVLALDLEKELAVAETRRAIGAEGAKITRKPTPFVRIKRFAGGQESLIVGARITDRKKEIAKAWDSGDWSAFDAKSS